MAWGACRSREAKGEGMEESRAYSAAWSPARLGPAPTEPQMSCVSEMDVLLVSQCTLGRLLMYYCGYC